MAKAAGVAPARRSRLNSRVCASERECERARECEQLARHEFNFASTDAIHLRHVRLSTSTSYTRLGQGRVGKRGVEKGRGKSKVGKTAVRQYNCFLECNCLLLLLLPLLSSHFRFATPHSPTHSLERARSTWPHC